MSYTLTGHFEKGDLIQLYRVKHRYEMGTLETSEPEVTRLEPMIYTPMTAAIQWMCFDLLFWDERHGDRTGVTDAEKRIYESLYRGTDPGRFITNGRGVDTCRNYISGERLSEPLPGYMSLVCGGNVLHGEEFTALNGIRKLQAEVLVDAAPASTIPPWQKQRATVCTTLALADGTFRVNAFPQRNGLDVWCPILCKSPVTIAMSKLVKLPPGAPIPSPYNPPR
jgi:hypothetical protein